MQIKAPAGYRGAGSDSCLTGAIGPNGPFGVKPMTLRLSMIGLRGAVAALALATSVSATAATQVLYDPAVITDPALAGWLAGSLVFVSTSYGVNGVSITPLGDGSVAGYSNYSFALVSNPGAPLVNAAFPVLNSAAGFRLGFGMDLDSENHSGNPDRAGFSVTLIGSDLKGVEIGFQSDRIFAQSLSGNSFVASTIPGESTTSASLVNAAFRPNRWDLAVTGGTYALTLGNQTVISGATHDYSSYIGNGQNAYRTPNFVFFGDNTTSARADFTFSYAAITTPVPEPEQAPMYVAGLAWIVWVRRRWSRARSHAAA